MKPQQIQILATIAVFLFILYTIANTGNKTAQKIGELKGENKVLLQNNKEILGNINKLKSSIEASDKKIDSLYLVERKLASQYQIIQNSIKNLKTQYDKANNFSANYNADSIRIYFSKLQ